jgi:hypothetical protein
VPVSLVTGPKWGVTPGRAEGDERIIRRGQARALELHLSTWPRRRPKFPVAGGVLIVNHQHKLHPTERSAEVCS